MSPWVKALVTKPDNFSLAPRTHMVEGGNRHLQVDFWALYVYVCTQTQSKYVKCDAGDCQKLGGGASRVGG